MNSVVEENDIINSHTITEYKNYSNTVIYKIQCKDRNCRDIYVGHTINFVNRQVAHKQCSGNVDSKNIKLYKTIMENGGWDNWEMIEIEKYNCNNLTEARIREQYYYELLNANLNSIPPYKKKITENKTENKKDKKGLDNKDDNNDNNENNNIKKYNFICEKCNFNCNKQSNWNIHITTNKHLDIKKDLPKPKSFICVCGIEYKHASGLSKHRKNCNKECNNVQTINEETINKTTEINRNNNTSSHISQEMILDIIKSNELYRKIIFELLKTIGETSKTYTNSLGGFGEEQQNKLDEKIITNIAKNVLVDKSS